MSQIPTVYEPPAPLSPFWNIISSSAGIASGIVVSFFLSPFLIRTLGDGPYGMLALIGEITGYYGLLDLGMRTVVGYFVARGVAKRDLAVINDVMHNIFWILLGAAGIVVMISLVVMHEAPRWFTIQGVSETDARRAILIMSIVFALGLPMSVFSSALYGLRRLHIVNGIEILFRLVSTVAIVIALRSGGRLMAFVLVQSAATLLRWGAERWMVHRAGLGKNLLFPLRMEKGLIRESMRIGMGNATINVSQLIANQLDLVVIATFLSTKWVTFFYIARTLCAYYSTVTATVTLPTTPHITHLHTVGQHDAVLSFYLRVSKLAALLSTWLAVGIVAYGHPFLKLWVGQEYVSGNVYYRSDIVLYLLISGIFCRMLQSMARQALLGMRELAFLTWINVAEAAANLAISLLLVRRFGLLGVALGTAAPMWVCHGIIMPIYMVRRFQISWKVYARAIVRPVVFTIALFGGLCGIAVSQYYPVSWVQLLVSATAASVVFIGLAAVFELTPEERGTVAAKFTFIQRLLPKKSLPV